MKTTKIYGRKEIRSLPRKKLKLTTFGKIVALSGSIILIIGVISIVKRKEEIEITDVIDVIDVTTSEKMTSLKIEDLESILEIDNKLLEEVPEVPEIQIKKVEKENYKIPLDENILDFLKVTTDYYNLDYYLVLALIRHESNFNANAIGNNESYGLMQIHKINHDWLKDELNIENFLNPYDNIEAGCHMLSDLFNKYEDENKVLMAYNFGETGASRQWEQGINNTDFTNKVLETKYLYSLGKEVD